MREGASNGANKEKQDNKFEGGISLLNKNPFFLTKTGYSRGHNPLVLRPRTTGLVEVKFPTERQVSARVLRFLKGDYSRVEGNTERRYQIL